MRTIKKLMTPARVLLFGYVIIIFAGALLLNLPISTRSGNPASFMECLFTATSATCVTGLVVHDTFTYWSYFGHAVILLLIQIGGLGFITMYILLAMATKQKIGLKQRLIMQESISAPQTGGIVKLTRFVIITTIALELLGAIVLAFRFCGELGFGKGIYFAVFHSVSAFCNAGFDLMGGRGEYSSLTNFSGDLTVNITVMLLVIIGGLGFYVWNDLVTQRFKVKRYTLQTKVVLSVTAFLIVLPALFIFIFESDGILSGRRVGEQILASLFQSVTTRTAGFNTVDIAALKQPVLLLMISLMLIGGSPGSTAGGMKTTTFSVLFFAVRSTFKKQPGLQCFNRRLEDDTMIRALAIIGVYLLLLLLASIFISAIDNISIINAMFESASAIGTVGLTTGITPSLGNGSRIILMLLMYFGRVGCLTMLYAVASCDNAANCKLPAGEIALG